MRFDLQAIEPVGWFFLLFQGVYIPWKAWSARARLAGGPTLPPRAQHFRNVIVAQAFLLPIALAVGFLHHMELYPRAWPTPASWLQAAFTLVAMLVLAWPRWRGAVARHDRRLYFFMPQGAKEQGLWIALSAMAAVVEETTYRGVTFSLLLWITGSAGFATLIAAAFFGLAHAFQSRLSMAIIFIHGVLLQFLMLQSGSLYLPMLIHFLYDTIAGLMLAKLGEEAGYPMTQSADGAP
jgi:membrane protease YdiL (CAAX protease family)